MPIQFECTTSYLGKEITVKTDDFKTLHRALAGIDDANDDANYFAKRAGAKDIAISCRTTPDGDFYYGVRDKRSKKNQSFGHLKKGPVPFFPKHDEGYYDPENSPQRSNGQGHDAPAAQQAEQRAPTEAQHDDGLPFN